MSVGRPPAPLSPASAAPAFRATVTLANHDEITRTAVSSTIPALWFPIDTHRIALPIATPADLRALEARAAKSAGQHGLMARAGSAAADFLLQQLQARTDHATSTSARRAGADRSSVAGMDGTGGEDDADHTVRVWFFAGPGNNGGDALVAATQLHRLGVSVRVTLPVAPTHGDALWALQDAQRENVPIQKGGPNKAQCRGLLQDGVSVDGLFGIGLSRPIGPPYAQWVALMDRFAEHGIPVLALDVPSGLDAMTGQAVSAPSEQGCAVHATHTLSFLGATPGLFTGKGRDHTGKLFLAPLARSDFAPPSAPDADVRAVLLLQPDGASDSTLSDAVVKRPPLQLNAPRLFMDRFPKRRPSSHKGTFGSVAIIGGDTGTSGAAILSARAALYTGAGRVHTALLGDGAPPYDPPHPEIMLRRIDAIALDTMDALSIGPGLGTSARAADIVRRVLHDIVGEHCHALLDADALNLISRDSALAQAVTTAGQWIVMTPHPGEAARLLGVDTKEIERDRLAAARALVVRFHCTIVLKGAGTLIAAPRNEQAGAERRSDKDATVDIVLNTTGNTGLSTGGTGDVLSGVIGALLAQHLPPREAAMAGVYLHGLAAESLAQSGEGPAGLTGGELAPRIRHLMNEQLREYGLIAG